MQALPFEHEHCTAFREPGVVPAVLMVFSPKSESLLPKLSFIPNDVFRYTTATS